MLVSACDKQSESPTQPQAANTPVKQLDRSHKGEPLPDIKVSDAAGQSLALSSLAGKPALVNLWATWCAPCIAELPTLNALAKENTVQVVTISQDTQTENVAQFLADKGGPHLKAWLDPNMDLAFHYGAGTLPATIFYDSKGREVWRFYGEQDWTGKAARALISEGK